MYPFWPKPPCKAYRREHPPRSEHHAVLIPVSNLTLPNLNTPVGLVFTVLPNQVTYY